MAVVGAGLAGLACALNLAQKRYQVTVFEQQPRAGAAACAPTRASPSSTPTSPGSSPPWRWSSASDAAVASLDELAEFDAVYVATGAGGDSFGLLESWDCGVYTTREPRVFLGGHAHRRHA